MKDILKRYSKFWPFYLLFIALLVIYWQKLVNGIPVKEDEYLLFQNPGIVQDNIFLFFSTKHINIFEPLAFLTYYFEKKIFGSYAFGPFINLIIHFGGVVLLFKILQQLRNKLQLSNLAIYFIITIFALHPLQVESVAWIVARMDLLGSNVLLLAIMFYIKYLNKRSWKYLILTFIALNLSFLAKPVGVGFFILAWVLDYLYSRKQNLQAIIEKLLFVANGLLIVYINFLFRYIKPNVNNYPSSGFFNKNIFNNIFEVVIHHIDSFIFYISKTIIPIGLVHDYPSYYDFLHWYHYLIGIIFVVSLVYFAKKDKVFRTPLLLWSFWFFVLILPFVQFLITFPDGFQYANRYMYLPIIGIVAIIIQLLDRHISKPLLWSPFIIIAIGFFSYQSQSFVASWLNQSALCRNYVYKYPKMYPPCMIGIDITSDPQKAANDLEFFLTGKFANKTPIYLSLVKAYNLLGRHADASKILNKISTANRAEAIDYLLEQAHLKLLANKFEDAEEIIQPLFRSHPNNPFVLTNIAALAIKRENISEAVQLLNKSIKIKPTFDAYSSLIHIHKYISKKPKQVIKLCTDLVNKLPNHFLGHYRCAMEFVNSERYSQAKSILQRLITDSRVRPDLKLNAQRALRRL